VFSDIKFPSGKSGLDLLDIVKRDHPQVQIFLTSGIVTEDALTGRGVGFMRKPYLLFDLERRIRIRLAGRKPPRCG